MPLLRQLSGASTLQEVLVGGGQALLLTCVAAVVGRKILQWVDQHLRSIPPSTDSGAAGQAFRALVSSALHQASVLLPWGAAAFGATIVCAVLQLAAERRADVLADLFTARTAAAVASSLRFLTQFLQDAAEEVAVLLW